MAENIRDSNDIFKEQNIEQEWDHNAADLQGLNNPQHPLVVGIKELEKQYKYDSDGNYNPISTSEDSDCKPARRSRSIRCYFDPARNKPHFEVEMIFRNKDECKDALTRHALAEQRQIRVSIVAIFFFYES